MSNINKVAIRGYMPKNHETKSKWQDASNLVNRYRTEISNTLRSFTDEERRDIRYDELIKDIKSNACKSIRDITPDKVGDCADSDKALNDSVSWTSKKLWVIILSSPVLVAIIPYIPNIYEFFKGIKL